MTIKMNRPHGEMSPFIPRLGDRAAQIPGALLSVVWSKGYVAVVANLAVPFGESNPRPRQVAVYSTECRNPRSEGEARDMALKVLCELIGIDFSKITGATLKVTKADGSDWRVETEVTP